MPSTPTTYRPEIDGLRALAILSVLLFHAGFQAFSGGFVGVDVFFVISGFLITNILITETQENKFSIVQFYTRRARRILPALFTVLAVVLFAGYFLVLPDDYKRVGQGAVATLSFFSNFYFYLKTDYFAPEAELNPLLHTWSLAVEEQFYLFFPLVLLFIRVKSLRYHMGTICLLLFASLCYSIWELQINPKLAFFNSLGRFWELLVGSILSAGLRARNRERFKSNTLAGVGIMLIVVPIFLYDDSVAFPSYSAIPPVLGAALVILSSDPTNLVGRLLSSKLLIGIGLISYSLYLWHQPVLAFLRYRSLDELTMSMKLTAICASFVAAYITYRFIEKPFRHRSNCLYLKIWHFVLPTTVVIGTIGAAIHLRDGLLDRNTAPNLPVGYFEAAERGAPFYINTDSGQCNFVEETSICRHDGISETEAKTRILFFGDSHALDYTHEIVKLAVKSKDKAISQLTLRGCSMLIERDSFDIRQTTACDNAKRLLRDAITNGKFDLYIGIFHLHSNREKVDHLINTDKLISASGSHFIIFEPRKTLKHWNTRAGFLGKTNLQSYVQTDEEHNQLLEQIFKEKQKHMIFREYDLILDKDKSAPSIVDGHTDEGLPIYFDRNHLSRYGAEFLFKEFELYLEDLNLEAEQAL